MLSNRFTFLTYPPRVRDRATVKLSPAFFHDESSITKRGGGGTKVQQPPFSNDPLRVKYKY